MKSSQKDKKRPKKSINIDMTEQKKQINKEIIEIQKELYNYFTKYLSIDEKKIGQLYSKVRREMIVDEYKFYPQKLKKEKTQFFGIFLCDKAKISQDSEAFTSINWNNIVCLSLQKCNIGDQIFKKLSTQKKSKNFQFLMNLDLQQNNITLQGLKQLNGFTEKFDYLRKINLNKNKIYMLEEQKINIPSLFQSFYQHKYLIQINIKNNSINEYYQPQFWQMVLQSKEKLDKKNQYNKLVIFDIKNLELKYSAEYNVMQKFLSLDLKFLKQIYGTLNVDRKIAQSLNLKAFQVLFKYLKNLSSVNIDLSEQLVFYAKRLSNQKQQLNLPAYNFYVYNPKYQAKQPLNSRLKIQMDQQNKYSDLPLKNIFEVNQKRWKQSLNQLKTKNQKQPNNKQQMKSKKSIHQEKMIEQSDQMINEQDQPKMQSDHLSDKQSPPCNFQEDQNSFFSQKLTQNSFQTMANQSKFSNNQMKQQDQLKKQIIQQSRNNNQQNSNENRKPKNNQALKDLSQILQFTKRGLQKSQKTRNKDIVVLLGKTGAGKSTLIHHLQDIPAQVITKDTSQKDIPAIINFKDQLEGFKIGHENKSETLQINTIQNKNVVLVDTAGFYDSKGLKYDIPNVIALEKAFHNAKSVKIILLINYGTIKSDGKCKPILQSISQFIGFIKKEQIQEFLPAITVLITHPIYQDQNIIITLLQQAIENQEKEKLIKDDQQRRNVLKFMQCMINGIKLQKKEQVINRRKQSKQDLINQLQKVQEKIKQIDTIQQEVNIQNQKTKIKRYNQQIEKKNAIKNKAQIQEMRQKIVQSQKNLKKYQLSLKLKQQPIRNQINQKLTLQYQLQQQQKEIQILQREYDRYKQNVTNKFNHFETLRPQKFQSLQHSKLLKQIIIKSQKIIDTKNNFQISIKNELKTSLCNYLNEIQIQTHQLLKEQNYSQIQKIFNLICQLDKYINYEFMHSKRIKLSEEIAKSLKKVKQRFSRALNNIFSQRIIIDQSIIKAINNYFQLIKSMEQLTSKIPNINLQQLSQTGFQRYFSEVFKANSVQFLDQFKKQQNIVSKRHLFVKLYIIHSFYGNKFGEINFQFKTMSKELTKQLISKVQTIKSHIQNRQYNELSIKIKFLYEIKDVMRNQFLNNFFPTNYSIDNIYNETIKRTKQSIQYIFVRFEQEIKAASHVRVKKIEKYYSKFVQIKSNGIMIQLLDYQTRINDIIQETQTKIVGHCSKLANIMQSLIKNNQYSLIQKNMQVFKQLRSISHKIQSKSFDQYYSFLRKFDQDIKQKTQNKIPQIILNVQKGTLKQQHIQVLNNVMKQLQSFKKIEKIVYEKKELKEDIAKNIRNFLFQKRQNCTNQLINTFQSQFTEVIMPQNNYQPQSTQSYQQCFSDNSSKPMKKTFPKTNSAIYFIQTCNKILNNTQQQYVEFKSDTTIKLNKFIQDIQSLFVLDVTQGKINYNLNERTLQKQLMKLLALTSIKIDNDSGVTLNRLCNKIRQYLRQCKKDIQNIQLQDHKRFRKCIQIQRNLLNSIEGYKSIIKSKIDITKIQQQNQIKQKLHLKFNQIVEKAREQLIKQRLTQAQTQIQILKHYRYDEIINTLINSQPKNKYQQLSKTYNDLSKSIPNKAVSLLDNQDFLELYQLLKNCPQYQKAKSKNLIVKQITLRYQNLIAQVSNIEHLQNTSLTNVNKSMIKFNKYQQIKKYDVSILQSSGYDKKRQEITSSIKNIYKKITDSIDSKIKNGKFRHLQRQFTTFYKIKNFLLRGIHQADYRLNQFNPNQLLNNKIEQINSLPMTKDNLPQHFQNLNIIKHYDSQFKKGDNYSPYKNNLKQKIDQICSSISESLKIVIRMQQLKKPHQQLMNLNNSIKKYIENDPQFKNIKQQIDKLEAKIKNLYTEFINHYRKPLRQDLAEIKKNNYDVYAGLLEQNQKNYVQFYENLKSAQKQKDYQKIRQNINNLQYIKYYEQDMRDYIKTDIKPSIESIKNRIRTNIKNHQNHIINQVSNQDIKEDAQFTQFQEYLKILIHLQNFTNEQQTQQLANQIIKCLNLIIPQKQQTLKEKNQKLQALITYKKFISILKKYNEQLIRTNYFNDQFKSKVNSIPQSDKYIKNVNAYLANIPKKIQELWQNNNVKQITQLLLQIQNIKTEQSQKALQKIIKQYKDILEKYKNLILKSIQQNNFKEVNYKINKLSKAIQQLQTSQVYYFQQSYYTQVIKFVQQKVNRQILQTVKQHIIQRKTNQIVQSVIKLQIWANNLPILVVFIDDQIKKILNLVKTKNISEVVHRIRQISQDKSELQKATICGQIIHKYSKLLSIPRILPNISLSFQDAVKEFKGDEQNPINVEQLKIFYDIYSTQYEYLKTKYISNGNKQRIQQNLNRLKDIIFQSKSKINSIYQNRNMKSNLATLLAQIFIYISLKISGESYYDARQKQIKGSNQFLFQPHVIQVLSILRFIGCDNKQSLLQKVTAYLPVKLDKLKNHIMQIKTGQGKSIILAAMSLLLAFMDYEVYCACYSEYLSKRDYDFFKEIFVQFKLQNKVKYGTFSKISEQFINCFGNVRRLVGKLFNKQIELDEKDQAYRKNQHYKQVGKQKRILLVDQVDTFFSKDFYGNTYNASTIFTNTQIKTIINLIWDHQAQNPEQIFKIVDLSQHYKTLTRQYHDIIDKINIQIKLIINDLSRYKQRDYVLQNRRIGYKQLDGISFNTVHGYQTMLHHLYQFKRKNIDQSLLNQHLGLSINCGSYSYAEIIENNFNKIFGVSGTLECLNQYQQNILKRYKITQKTFTPSVYGQSKRKKKPILIEYQSGKHQLTIAKIIKDCLKNQQALAVFFENQTKLNQFYNSSSAQQLRDRIKIVTQKTPDQDRDILIKNATKSESVTLFTASFGRGTDFQIFDPNIKQKGFYVIQTFLSEDLSQQIQIQGRTARQGSEGIHQLVLNGKQLQTKFKITKDMIQKAKQTSEDSISNLFQRMRQDYNKQANQKRQIKLNQAKVKHHKSIQIRDLILKNKISRNNQFFFQSVSISNKTRICIIIDSTGSMGSTIDAVKGKVMQMIQKLQKHYPNMFQIQIMFYYGDYAYKQQSNSVSASWSSSNKLHISQWTSNVSILKRFLTSARASGGSNHEAIQVGLHHLIKSYQQVGVNKAILIGDAGLQGKLDSSMTYVIHPSDAYRYNPRQTKKPLTLRFGDLLKQLAQLGISVDTYPISNGQKIDVTCKQISGATKGKMTPFDPQKDDLAAQIEMTIKQCISSKR